MHRVCNTMYLSILHAAKRFVYEVYSKNTGQASGDEQLLLSVFVTPTLSFSEALHTE